MSPSNGTFLISLDFELHWGRCHSYDLHAGNIDLYLNTRRTIFSMLKLFEQHDISATWAAVGMLFNESMDEWMANKPALLPGYQNKTVCTYTWVEKNIGRLRGLEKALFAKEIILAIAACPAQELGTHTYSHYFCAEPGQNAMQFEADLKMAKRMADSLGIQMVSLVFPRNQFNQEYLSVCKRVGLRVVRSNPAVWYWNPRPASSLSQRAARLADTYLPIPPNKTFVWNKAHHAELPVQLPASRIFKPWTPGAGALNKIKLKRILQEMTLAARSQRAYHIWWHPHNFGHHPQPCIRELEIVLRHFQFLKNKYGFTSKAMGQMWPEE
jgi:peptidoglycan/xylan/chitin deacetylase (PgdA/CDA1 family)